MKAKPSMAKVEGNCRICLKATLFGINIILTFVGFGLLVLSVWLFILRSHMSSGPSNIIGDTKLSLVFVLIAISLLLISVSFCGFCGILQENKYLLAIHLLFGLTCLALVTLGGVLVNRLSSRPESFLREHIMIYGRNVPSTEFIDKTQELFKCCGVEDLSSWKALSLPVPASCCVTPGSITCRETIASASGLNVTGVIYTEGCAQKLASSAFIKVTVPILAVIGVANLLGAVLATILCATVGPDADFSQPLLSSKF